MLQSSFGRVISRRTDHPYLGSSFTGLVTSAFFLFCPALHKVSQNSSGTLGEPKTDFKRITNMVTPDMFKKTLETLVKCIQMRCGQNGHQFELKNKIHLLETLLCMSVFAFLEGENILKTMKWKCVRSFRPFPLSQSWRSFLTFFQKKWFISCFRVICKKRNGTTLSSFHIKLNWTTFHLTHVSLNCVHWVRSYYKKKMT